MYAASMGALTSLYWGKNPTTKGADLCGPDRLIDQGNLDVSGSPDDVVVCDNVALVIPEKP